MPIVYKFHTWLLKNKYPTPIYHKLLMTCLSYPAVKQGRNVLLYQGTLDAVIPVEIYAMQKKIRILVFFVATLFKPGAYSQLAVSKLAVSVRLVF